MKLGIIILAHKLPEQLRLLVRALQHPSVEIYLHIDRRSQLTDFRGPLREWEVQELPRHRSAWSAAGGLDATVDGFRAALRDGCDYCLVLSGQDLPLRPVADIVAFFEAHHDTSYLRHWPVSATNDSPYGGRERTDFYAFSVFGRREFCIPRGEETGYLSRKGHALNAALRLRASVMGPRKAPAYVAHMRGDAWCNATREAVAYALAFLTEHPGFRAYHEYTFAPDELFFPTILAGAHYDGAVENESLRYIVPTEGFHPKVLMLEDMPRMLASDKLFARKFDMAVDRAVVEELASRVTTSGA